MAISWQIPRNCLAWLLLAQVSLLLPHLQRLPWWVLATYLCCAIWRIMIYQGRWSLPPKAAKAILAVLCFVGIYRSYGTLVGLEPTVALLFSGFSLKLLEVGSRRDVYLLIFLAYFVDVTGFLFTQELFASLYQFACLAVITAALVALHQHNFDSLNLRSFTKAVTILGQALPLTIVLFLVFPRFSPLWSVPLPKHQGKTGIGDSMSPGDVSQLGLSDELAFRVTFDGRIPPRSQMYWRGLVLAAFDGRTWRQGRAEQHLLNHRQRDLLRQSLRQPLSYTVIQEPSYRHWVFTLPLAYSNDPDLEATTDFRLLRKEPIRSRIQFRVSSDLSAPLQPLQPAPAPQAPEHRALEQANRGLSDWARHYYTSLPGNGNDRARLFAQRQMLEAGNPRALVRRILDYYSQQDFHYTLKPPRLGENPVDEFLFTTRRGFCEHYASSFVFLMRAAGIPSRVVTGYQGGEINPLDRTVSVRQYDAHAWAEVWMQERGWVRVDPTAAVSPLRIERGLEEALQQGQEQFLADSPLSPMRYRHIAWLNQLRLQLESLNYYWTKWVLNYRDEQQTEILKSLLGKITPTRVAALVFTAGALLFALAAWQLIGSKRDSGRPEERLYLSLCRALQRAGFVRKPQEGPIDFARRVAERQPAWKSGLLAATRAYVSLSYEPLSKGQRRIVYKRFRLEVLKLRYRLRVSRA